MKQGFSLVELSIVLVILGLLTGGILAGQSLIRAAELRAVGTEYQRWLTATHSFRDKYMAIPGDFRDATQFWGRQQSSDCVSNAGIVATTTTGVCDGDGNNFIQLTPVAAAATPNEAYQFWRHLSAAGMVEGNYSGLSGAGNANGSHCTTGQDCPASKLGKGGWATYYQGIPNSGGFLHDEGDKGHVFVYGTQHSSGYPSNIIMTPAEAWNIDTKIDDGKPGRGRVIINYRRVMCALNDDGTTAVTSNRDITYNLASSDVLCAFYFINAY